MTEIWFLDKFSFQISGIEVLDKFQTGIIEEFAYKMEIACKKDLPLLINGIIKPLSDRKVSKYTKII